jgi:hypothetical protein
MSCNRAALFARGRCSGEYEAATRNFAESVGDLRQRIGTSAKGEYEPLQRASDVAIKMQCAWVANDPIPS